MAAKQANMSDVAFEQSVFFKQKATFTTAYHQYWGVLRRESRSGKQRVELFDIEKHSTYPIVTVNLTDVLHVMKREARAHRHGFQILAMGNKYHFAARSADECSQWIQAMNKVVFGPPEPGVEYEYRVRVLKNVFSTDLALTGLYLLVVGQEELVLNSSGGLFPSRFKCSLSQVEKVAKLSKGSFVIHTKSSSEVGKGIFTFDSTSAPDIVKNINLRMKAIGVDQNNDWTPPNIQSLLSGDSAHSRTVPKHATAARSRNMLWMPGSIPKSATIEALSPLQESSPLLESEQNVVSDSSEDACSSGDEQSTDLVTMSVGDHYATEDTFHSQLTSASLSKPALRWSLAQSGAVLDTSSAGSNTTGTLNTGSSNSSLFNQATPGRTVAIGHSIIDCSSPDSSTTTERFALQQQKTFGPSRHKSLDSESSLDSADKVLRQIWREKRHSSLPSDQPNAVNSSDPLSAAGSWADREKAALTLSAASLSYTDADFKYVNTSYIHSLLSQRGKIHKTQSVQMISSSKHQFFCSQSHMDSPISSSPLLEGRSSPPTRQGNSLPCSRSVSPSSRGSPTITPHHSPTKATIPAKDSHGSDEEIDGPPDDSFDSIDTWIPGWKAQKTQRLQKIQMHRQALKESEEKQQQKKQTQVDPDVSTDEDEDDPLKATYLEVLPDHAPSQKIKHDKPPPEIPPKPRSPLVSSGQISPVPKHVTSLVSSSSPLWPLSECSSPATSHRVGLNWENSEDSGDEDEKYSKIEARKSRSLSDLILTTTLDLGSLQSTVTPPLAALPPPDRVNSQRRPEHVVAATVIRSMPTADQSDGTGECVADWLGPKTTELPYQVLPLSQKHQDEVATEAKYKKSHSVRRPSATKAEDRKDTQIPPLIRHRTSPGISIPRLSTSSADDPIYASIGSQADNSECFPPNSPSSDDGYSCLDDIMSLTKAPLQVNDAISPYSSVRIKSRSTTPMIDETSLNDWSKRDSRNYDYDYPYMDMEQQRKDLQRKKMVLEMLRRLDPEEEKGVYVGIPKPDIVPRPVHTFSDSLSVQSTRKISTDTIYEVLSPNEHNPAISPEAPSIPPHHPLLSPKATASLNQQSLVSQHESALPFTTSSVSLV